MIVVTVAVQTQGSVRHPIEHSIPAASWLNIGNAVSVDVRHDSRPVRNAGMQTLGASGDLLGVKRGPRFVLAVQQSKGEPDLVGHLEIADLDRRLAA
jgi:hypothetical protein